MLVHVTPNAENQMHEAGQLDRLKTMREECSSRDGSFVVDRAYRKRHPRYVFRWGQYRGFAGLYEVCGTEVLSILACIRRGADAHYSQLLTGFLGGENVITEPSEEELKAFVDSEEGPPPPPPPSLPDEYRGWLLPPRWVTASVEASEEGPGRKELVVYETRAWVDAMRGIGEFHWRPIHEELQRIHDELSRGGALEDLPSMEVSSPGVWRLRTEQGFGRVAFSVFDVTGPTARRILFLLTPSWPANRDAQDELLLRHHPALADEGCSDAEPTWMISRRSRRSYLRLSSMDEEPGSRRHRASPHYLLRKGCSQTWPDRRRLPAFRRSSRQSGKR